MIVKEYQLKDLLTIKNGKDYRSIESGNIPVYGTGGIMTYINDYLYDGESILLPRKGSLDNIGYVNDKFWTVDTMYWSIVNKELAYPKYLYCYLKLLDLSCRDSGSTLPSMTFDSYYTLKINLPSITTQKKVGDFVFTIINKIKNNNKLISELESMAKTIYDYWFLQYEFPNEEGKPYKSSGGKMIYNEELKKEIPVGWKVKEVQDYCNIFTGKKDVNQALDKGKYKFFSCSPDYKYSDDKLYEGKAILISGNGSYTGRTIFVNDSFDLYQRTYACTNNYENDYMEYIYYSMLKLFVPRVSGGTHGSAIPYIVYNDIAKQQIVMDETIVGKFTNIIKGCSEKIINLNKENEELTKLRDELLPLLMNGQVSFKN